MSKKILLVQLFSNGDCLYCTAIARQIKKDFPNSHITWAIAPFCKGVLSNNPHVDSILEITSVPKNDIVSFRVLKKELLQQKKSGTWDEVFFTMNMGENQALYDGCIRTNILNAYPYPITEGIQPVLHFSETEKGKVDRWASDKMLDTYKHIILFEFAPQSGQSALTRDIALAIAKQLAERGDTAIILSSAQAIPRSHPAIIDGSELSYRESVYLSNHCTLLLGCSSGITWGTTSDGGKFLPMLQLLNPWTPWVNPISRDFKRQGLPVDEVIELVTFDERTILQCLHSIFTDGFKEARIQYNQAIPLHFKTTRKIVYNLLCYLQFAAIAKHLQVNIKVWGLRPSLFKETLLAILFFPFTLVKNKIRKRGQA